MNTDFGENPNKVFGGKMVYGKILDGHGLNVLSG